MRRVVPLALALVLGGGAVSAQIYRGGADIVLLNVTVTDSDGHLVSGLDRDSFQIFEDGALQRISNFTRDQQPIALSILVDTSTSMEKRLGVAQQAAIGFTQRLGPRDVAQIMSFNSRAETLQDFTGDRSALETAILKTRAGGSTALYNAVYTALNDLKRVVAKSPEEIRRQAIVVLSDGEDTSSLIDYEQVEESAKRSEVSVYTIALRSKDESPQKGFNEADFVMRTLAQDTGGSVFHIQDVAELSAVYQRIADELANQYTMGYTSTNPKRDGAWRRIVVRINRPGVGARTKSGYFGPTISR
jgi:Ca-activated chloride channel family protein